MRSTTYFVTSGRTSAAEILAAVVEGAQTSGLQCWGGRGSNGQKQKLSVNGREFNWSLEFQEGQIMRYVSVGLRHQPVKFCGRSEGMPIGGIRGGKGPYLMTSW